jgi:hypothetical protein
MATGAATGAGTPSQPFTPFSGVKEPERQQLPLPSFQTDVSAAEERQLPVVTLGPLAQAVTAMVAKSSAILLSCFMRVLVGSAATCSQFGAVNHAETLLVWVAG